MLKTIMRKIIASVRSILISATGLMNGIKFSPFATVSATGLINISPKATIKKAVLNAQGGEITLSRGVWLNDGVEINSHSKIFLGEGTTIQRNVTINGEVNIGSECLFAPNVFISSTSHVHDYLPGLSIREQERRISKAEFFKLYNKPITIGDDVWLGANVVVMPGINIGSHVIIGSNSVVNQDIPPGVIAAGVPVKIIKMRQGFHSSLDVLGNDN